MTRRVTSRRAFTLLEVLVATAITALLAGSLYATLHIAFKARRAASSAVENVRKVELALEFLRSDLESSVVPTGILAGAFVGQAGTDVSGRASDTLLLHATAPGRASAQGTGDIRLVELSCEPDEDGTSLRLLRRVNRNLLAPSAGEPDVEVLCRGVYAFVLRYYDGTDWLDEWDSTTQDNALPAAVEVTLQLRDNRQTETVVAGYTMSRVFLLPCSTVTAGTEAEMPLF